MRNNPRRLTPNRCTKSSSQYAILHMIPFPTFVCRWRHTNFIGSRVAFLEVFLHWSGPFPMLNMTTVRKKRTLVRIAQIELVPIASTVLQIVIVVRAC